MRAKEIILADQLTHVRNYMTNIVLTLKNQKMKNLKKLSRKELKNLTGGKLALGLGYSITDEAEAPDKECILNWIKCPGAGLAKVGPPNVGLICC